MLLWIWHKRTTKKNLFPLRSPLFEWPVIQHGRQSTNLGVEEVFKRWPSQPSVAWLRVPPVIAAETKTRQQEECTRGNTHTRSQRRSERGTEDREIVCVCVCVCERQQFGSVTWLWIWFVKFFTSALAKLYKTSYSPNGFNLGISRTSASDLNLKYTRENNKELLLFCVWLWGAE